MDPFNMDSLKGVVPENMCGVKFMGDFINSDVAGGCSIEVSESIHYDDYDDLVISDMSDMDEFVASDSNREPSDLMNDRCMNRSDDKNIKLKTFMEKDDEIESKSKLLKKYRSQYSNVLSVQIVEELEKDLGFYEKISILFLVYEDQQLEFALQRLIVACVDYSKMSNLLFDWCLTEPKFWREKLLQALVIVNNFYVLLKLGYNKNDARSLFYKKNYIPSVRKKIYNFCESLSIEEAKCLIDEVNNDLKLKNIYNGSEMIDCDPKFLEVSFLFWSSRKYISFYSKNVDLSNLINCLNGSEKCSDFKKLLLVVNNKYSHPKSKSSQNKSLSSNKSEEKIKNIDDDPGKLPSVENNITVPQDSLASVSTVTTTSSISTNWSQEFKQNDQIWSYEIINSSEIGVCIVINQKNFKNRASNIPSKFLSDEPLPDRDGTEVDVQRIELTFSRLRYKVFVFNDVTHNNLLSCIKTTVQSHFNPRVHSSIFLFMLTHGCQGHVYTCDSVAIPIELVKRTLWESKCLNGKPKGVILQACQGNVPQEVMLTDGPNSNVQGQRDLFLGLATVEGNVAFRSTSKGTWFIQTLCQCIDEFAYTTDFAKIFTRVNDKLSKKRASDASCSRMYGQIAECRSSLCLEWYLVHPKCGSMIPAHDGIAKNA